tara:strand:+ start:145 stop:1893 length:1749 start_codon:yes stop_codon:yes gene_type:complete
MFAHTCFNNKSDFGYKASILKSGICKYFRRGEKDKFVWCVMEMSKFYDICEEQKGAIGLLSNLINRLKILLMEDTSFCEVNRIYNGIKLLEEYGEDRSKRELLLEFCDVVCECKRNRVTSYVNNWWRFREIDIEIFDIKKAEKYRKKGDSDELLILGENLIEYIELKDERMFGIFMKMIKLEGKMGIRYRRKDGDYLWWEIMEDYIEDDIVKEIWKFGFDRYIVKGMKERLYFGVWIGLMVWKRDILNFEDVCGNAHYLDGSDVNKYYKNMKKLIMDDYVVNDFHVNKSFGLADFGKNGAFVKDEDLSMLGVNGKLYKDYYLEVKVNMDKGVKKKVNKIVKEKEGELEMIKWEEFKLVKVIEEGVCGGKVPCLIVDYKDKRYILKEMKLSMNFGKDYIVVDKCKKLFGLKDMNMKRIKCDKCLIKIDSKNTSYVKNCEIGEKECIYCMMDYWENVGDLGKNKKFLDDEDIVYECLKIRLFDGLFMSSDNILRNILVNEKGELLSIDEGDLYGKRKLIFNKKGDWCKTNVSDELLVICLEEIIWNIIEKKKIVLEIMDYYGLDYKNEFLKRIDNYKEIVWEEW